MRFFDKLGIKFNYPPLSQEEIDAREKRRLEKEFWQPNAGEQALRVADKIGQIDQAAQQRSRRR